MRAPARGRSWLLATASGLLPSGGPPFEETSSQPTTTRVVCGPMLVVRVEMWPGGDELLARNLGRMEISNISDLAPVSDYLVVVQTGKDRARREVKGHTRDDGFWELVRKACDALPLRPQSPLEAAVMRAEVAEEELRNVSWSLDETQKAFEASVDLLAKAQFENDATKRSLEARAAELQAMLDRIQEGVGALAARAEAAENYIRKHVQRTGTLHDRMEKAAESMGARGSGPEKK